MSLRSIRRVFPTRFFVCFLLLSIALSACDGGQSTPTTSTTPTTSAVVTWPFDPHDGQWAIINGYRGEVDHAPGASPNNYAIFALDFAKCLPDKVITSQGSEATCDLPSGWANTVGAAVYSPVSGTVAWPDEGCHGLSMDVDGQTGFRIVLFHIDPLPGMSWSQLASNHTHFNQGDKIGTVSAGSCIGSGNHIHMALYSCTDCSSDPASQRVGHPFSDLWSISSTPFPDDGQTSNEYLGLLVPLQQVAAPTPTPTTIPAPVPTPTQPPTPTPAVIAGIDPFVGTWGVSGINVLTINADGSGTWQARGQNAQIQFTSVQGNTLYGTVTSGTVTPIALSEVGNLIPTGGNITVTLIPGGVQVSEGDMFCQPSSQCAY